MTNVGQYTPGKNPSTKFIVRNTAPGNKRVRIFQYPIGNGLERDLLAIPGISEADIRHSLLKGQLLEKLRAGEITIVDSDIDLLQFNDDQKAFLETHGVTKGLEVEVGQSGIPEAQHKVLRHLVHLAEEGGPFDGFSSGAYRETLPVAAAFPTSEIWWESSAKLKKILEKTTVWNDAFPVSITYKAYDLDGTTVIATSTDTITYSNAFEVSRIRTFS